MILKTFGDILLFMFFSGSNPVVKFVVGCLRFKHMHPFSGMHVARL